MRRIIEKWGKASPSSRTRQGVPLVFALAGSITLAMGICSLSSAPSPHRVAEEPDDIIQPDCIKCHTPTTLPASYEQWNYSSPGAVCRRVERVVALASKGLRVSRRSL